MQIKIIGSHIELGQSFTAFVEENLSKDVKKYFENAVSAEVHVSKNKHNIFKVLIVVNEGVKGGIVVKSDAESSDVYACFSEAVRKAVYQLRRYKDRIKNYRRSGRGVKSLEADFESFEAMKYTFPALGYDVEYDENAEFLSDEFSTKIIEEKVTNIETLTVDEAVMKMDLANLPALVFLNKLTGKISVVYHRKDGNISLIDTNNNN